MDDWEEYKVEIVTKRFDLHSHNELGRGCFGTVYRVEDAETKKFVAPKVINPAQAHAATGLDVETIKKMFHEEKNLLQKLNHTNIAKCCHYFRYKPRKNKPMHFCIVMEYGGDGTLRDYLSNTDPLDEPTARYFAAQIKNALLHMRERGVVHRDLAPKNIVLSEQGPKAILKVVDFGVSALKKELSAKRLTVFKCKIGTPWYRAPETLMGGDVPYQSNGIVLVHLSTFYLFKLLCTGLYLYSLS